MSDFSELPPAKTNYMFDCAAEIVTDKPFDEVPVSELVQAMRQRLDRILAIDEREAFGICDEYPDES